MTDGDPTSPAVGRRRRPRRATRPGVEERTEEVRAWEDDDRAWGEPPSEQEDRIRREVPPHWS